MITNFIFHYFIAPVTNNSPGFSKNQLQNQIHV